ncbi:alcohol dehydrogenase catalytic domain-containing protein [Nonomuraea dietziae]|uniref:alcohol dehydrogenase catalytic domain-containing protein n=1 Tax=Nonomuraea dietziae TaxID=65515 RepID=UPI0033FA9C18
MLVQVSAVSLNFGEIAYRSPDPRPGHVPGWDAAGVVVQAAADGSGPAVGDRVVTFGWSGAWAELRAVDTRRGPRDYGSWARPRSCSALPT